MHWRQKVKLALEILRRKGRIVSMGPGCEDHEGKAREVIDAAVGLLVDDASDAIEKALAYGLKNQEIAGRVGEDESVISRLHSKSHDLQIALPTLQRLIEKLHRELSVVAHERAQQLLASGSLTPIDFCRPVGVSITDKDVSDASQVLLHNVVVALTGHPEKRRPLPPYFLGVLARLGPEESGLHVYQSDGGTDRQRLSHEIHELEHILKRKKDQLETLERRERGGRRTGRPRSEF